MIGEKISKLRKEKALSQESLADKLHVSASTISMYERGHRVPDYDKMLELCQLFDVSMDYMYDRSLTPHPENYLYLSAAEKTLISSLRDDNRIIYPADIPAISQFLSLDEQGKKILKAAISSAASCNNN